MPTPLRVEACCVGYQFGRVLQAGGYHFPSRAWSSFGHGGKSLGKLGIVEQMPRTTWSSFAVSVGRSEVRLRTTLEKDSWCERFAAFSNSSASTSIAVVFVGIY